ncbi:MAG: hypothetical protein R3F14_29340 [Polyangiaceae bacterium]
MIHSADGRGTPTNLPAFGAPLTAVCLSPDGALVAGWGDGSAVRVWNIETREELPPVDTGAPVTAVDLGKDGALVAGTKTGEIWFGRVSETGPGRLRRFAQGRF